MAFFLTICLLTSLSSLLYARVQETVAAPSAPAFEVASVRQNTTGADPGSVQVFPGRIVAANVALRSLITFAYDIDPSLQKYVLVGGAEELLARRFDIAATVKTADVSKGLERLMLRRLLADRFKLNVRTETRQIPAYVVAVARAGTLGPGLRPSEHDCEAFLAARADGGKAPEPKDNRGRAWCTGNWDFGRRDGIGLRYAGEISQFIRRVQAFADRPLADRTGLMGDFEWTLEFGFVPFPPPDATSPSLPTAFREQLGLELRPEIAPIEVLVIDSVSMPAPN